MPYAINIFSTRARNSFFRAASWSKVLEKIIADQTLCHIITNELLDNNQCAYRPGYSTETALLATQDMLWSAHEQGFVSALILTDLSAAFDTVDHRVLLRRLKTCFSIKGPALSWFQSYLSERSFRVSHNGATSSHRLIDCGVPQGSVLGPLLFSCYVSPIRDVISKIHGVVHISYADDLQVIVSARSSAACQLIASHSVEIIRSWLVRNGLAFNDSKLELMCFNPTSLTIVNDFSLTIGSVICQSQDTVRNLGVQFNKTMNLEVHVASVAKACFAILRNLWKIRHWLTIQSAKSLAHVHIISRLDYCNSLLLGCTNNIIQPLQRIQNCAARFVYGLTGHCPTSTLLRELHWLPVKQRIQFKLLTITHNTMYSDHSPALLRSKITILPSHSQRISADRLQTSPHRLRTGGKAFRHSAPTAWNSLPTTISSIKDIKRFKAALKTHLFYTTW